MAKKNPKIPEPGTHWIIYFWSAQPKPKLMSATYQGAVSRARVEREFRREFPNTVLDTIVCVHTTIYRPTPITCRPAGQEITTIP